MTLCDQMGRHQGPWGRRDEYDAAGTMWAGFADCGTCDSTVRVPSPAGAEVNSVARTIPGNAQCIGFVTGSNNDAGFGSLRAAGATSESAAGASQVGRACPTVTPHSDPGHSPAPYRVIPADHAQTCVSQVQCVMEAYDLKVGRVDSFGLIGRDPMGWEIFALVLAYRIEVWELGSPRQFVMLDDDEAMAKLERIVAELVAVEPLRRAS